VAHVLETSRLRLRELAARDLDFVASMLGDPEVMRHYPSVYTREQAEQWIERQRARYARDGHGLWLAEERESGAPLGQIGLLLQSVDGVDEPEVGYLLARRFWGRGFATEAAAAVRDHAFGALGKPRVISLIRPANLPSQAVAQRLGMRAERRTQWAGFEHLVYALARRPLPVTGP
jgi:RimJ/RimL family protein N-acetyltransferase